ncbi:hypothetical protein J6590_012983 [Homalodisca vitripennis]|nr:hypothetical protein J6590_012983 [Homalodisca vitripennis]
MSAVFLMKEATAAVVCYLQDSVATKYDTATVTGEGRRDADVPRQAAADYRGHSASPCCVKLHITLHIPLPRSTWSLTFATSILTRDLQAFINYLCFCRTRLQY